MKFADAIVAKLKERADRHDEIGELISDPEIASDPKQFPDLLKERGTLDRARELYGQYVELQARRVDNEGVLEAQEDSELVELAEEDLALVEEAEVALDLEIKGELIQDEDSHRDRVIFEIRAGTGGDEATLFAGDLYRMYSKFIETNRWRTEVLDVSQSEVGGFKEVIFGVRGPGCWSALRFESGGHRVQRVPSTESQGRIHTSAATVAVLAEAEAAEITVEEKDLRIDTMRAGGPGGQAVNKLETAVRITHLPTGTVVQCQDEKSQHKNRDKAMRILRTRLLDAERQRLHDERAAERKSQVGTGDRSARVRTYNFPQNRVTDHRLGENYSLEQVIAGKLDALVADLEAQDREERIQNL